MKSIKETFTAFAVGALAMTTVAVSASDSEHRTVMIKMDKSNDQDAVVDLTVDGNAEAFTLPDLEVGETRTITTKSGNDIVVSKDEDGLTINLDGEEVDIPSFSGNLGARIHRSSALHQMIEDSVHISGVKLDDNQKQIIRDAFLAAGIDKKVKFNDNSFAFITASPDIEVLNGDSDFHWVSDGENKIEVIVDEEINSNDIKIIKKKLKVKKED